MSLLDTASLIVTPNGYKEGKLYSVIPSDGSGDFTFTRATTATRVNSAGLVELVPYNLLSYSEEFNNAYWTKSSVTIISNDTTAPNGTLTADKLYPTSSGNFRHVRQTSFNPYTGLNTMSIYAKKAELSNLTLVDYDGSGAGINFNLNTGVATDYATTPFVSYSMTAVGDGWYRCTATALNGYFYWMVTNGGNSVAVTASGTDGIYLWGAQLVEGSTALPYQKTETRLNIPRLDYSLGGCPNILLEPQRTNLVTYSENLSLWAGTEQTLTTELNPKNEASSYLVTPNTSTNYHEVSSNNVGNFSGSTVIISFYAKPNGYNWVRWYNNIIGVGVDINIDNETVSNKGSEVGDVTFQSINGWKRVSIVYNSARTFTYVMLSPRPSDYGSSTFAGDGINGMYIWGAQAEVGSYATSYIPTTTASVTRNKDTTVEKDLTSFGIGNSYTLLFDLTMATEDSNKILFYLKNSAGADSFTFRNFSGILSVYDAIGLTYPLAALANESTKWAFRFDGVNYSLFRVSGGVAVKNTATLGTARNIGYLNSFNISGTKASLKLLAIEPSALTDAECEQFVIS
jgi:hypothetical protein